ncbi:unnamed protein product [Lymnaea stagnalis]|uniref:C2H2-type domain-containing protein n=1 Tax=Lymnaea stagnalis TaxID=6523 RepID=A0AAV2H9Y3_LYMST
MKPGDSRMSIPRGLPDLSSPPPNLPNMSKPPPNISNTQFYNGNTGGAGPFPPPHFPTNNNYRHPFGFPRMPPNQNRPNYQPRYNQLNQCPPRQPFCNRFNYDINRFMYPPHIVPGQTKAPDEKFSGAQQMNVTPQENFSNSNGSTTHFQGQGHTPWRGPNPTSFRGGFPPRGGQGGGRNQGFKKKKETVDKRLLPENNVFFCDICDRGFKNEELYKQHTDGHIKCSYKDCPFIAAPKLVQLHMSMQHKTGLAKKVWSLESEEDVNKWREERKRCFPTLENVEKKKQELAAKIARGECIQTKDFSKMKDGRQRGRDRRGRGRGGRRGRWRNQEYANKDFPVHEHRSGSDDDAPEEIQIRKSSETLEGSPDEGGQPNQETSAHKDTDLESKTKGLALLASYGDSSSESEEIEDFSSIGVKTLEVQSETSSAVRVQRANLLPNPFTQAAQTTGTPTLSASSIIVNGSSNSTGKNKIDSFENQSPDSLEDEGPNITTTTCNTGLSDGQVITSDRCENILTEKTDPGQGKAAADITQKRFHVERNDKGPNDRGPSYKRMRRGAPHEYTLLEKLLAPEIRRERNKVLQCVHYIIKHKFFHSSSTSCDQETV